MMVTAAFGLRRRFLPVVQADLKVGPEAPEIGDPVVKSTGWCDDECPTANRTDCLHCLPKPHVIRKQRAELGVAQQTQPIDAATLIVAQVDSEAGRKLRGGNSREIVDQCCKTREFWWWDCVQRLAQRGGDGTPPALQLSGLIAGGVQAFENGSVALEPVVRELRQKAARGLDCRRARTPDGKDPSRGKFDNLACRPLRRKCHIVVGTARLPFWR